MMITPPQAGMGTGGLTLSTTAYRPLQLAYQALDLLADHAGWTALQPDDLSTIRTQLRFAVMSAPALGQDDRPLMQQVEEFEHVVERPEQLAWIFQRMASNLSQPTVIAEQKPTSATDECFNRLQAILLARSGVPQGESSALVAADPAQGLAAVVAGRGSRAIAVRESGTVGSPERSLLAKSIGPARRTLVEVGVPALAIYGLSLTSLGQTLFTLATIFFWISIPAALTFLGLILHSIQRDWRTSLLSDDPDRLSTMVLQGHGYALQKLEKEAIAGGAAYAAYFRVAEGFAQRPDAAWAHKRIRSWARKQGKAELLELFDTHLYPRLADAAMDGDKDAFARLVAQARPGNRAYGEFTRAAAVLAKQPNASWVHATIDDWEQDHADPAVAALIDEHIAPLWAQRIRDGKQKVFDRLAARAQRGEKALAEYMAVMRIAHLEEGKWMLGKIAAWNQTAQHQEVRSILVAAARAHAERWDSDALKLLAQLQTQRPDETLRTFLSERCEAALRRSSGEPARILPLHHMAEGGFTLAAEMLAILDASRMTHSGMLNLLSKEYKNASAKARLPELKLERKIRRLHEAAVGGDEKARQELQTTEDVGALKDRALLELIIAQYGNPTADSRLVSLRVREASDQRGEGKG